MLLQTAHRAQGATMPGTAILDVRSAFAPAIVFVMCSRVTTRSNLFILGGLKPEDFVPITPMLSDMTPQQVAQLSPQMRNFLDSLDRLPAE